VALENINAREGVIGYILRSPTSASVDLKDSSKIIDYAVLSATAFESSENLSRLFALGKMYSVVLEGKDVKILCLKIGDHRLSVFMEKNVDHNSIYKKLT
jgi:predicted regulator of Ras-like GTPase activity (Roadblock/LC7/MglB family)